MLAAYLGLIDADLTDTMRQLVADDRDGPIHMVHLLRACEHAARTTGGGMPGSAGPGGHDATQLLTTTVSGDALPALVDALRNGGFPAATHLARSMDADLRYRVLDSLLSYWGTPITALCMDLTPSASKAEQHMTR